MEKERQFQIQKALSWNWSVKFFYPILVVLEIWAVYQYLQNPGKLFADPMQLLLTLLLTGMIISWAATYIRLFRWSHGNMAAIKKGEPLTEQDLKRTLKCKSILYGRWDPDTGSYSAGISFFHGGSDQLYTFLHPHCTDRPFRKKMEVEVIEMTG